MFHLTQLIVQIICDRIFFLLLFEQQYIWTISSFTLEIKFKKKGKSKLSGFFSLRNCHEPKGERIKRIRTKEGNIFQRFINSVAHIASHILFCYCTVSCVNV